MRTAQWKNVDQVIDCLVFGIVCHARLWNMLRTSYKLTHVDPIYCAISTLRSGHNICCEVIVTRTANARRGLPGKQRTRKIPPCTCPA